jgi:hypothetical protein
MEALSTLDRIWLLSAGNDKKSVFFFAKIRISCYRRLTRRIEPAAFGTLAGEGEGDRDFFPFSRRNPLKSPDSDE